MRNIRAIHLYLGCLFAPLLIFFTITGAWQTFNLHHARKDGSYQPFAIVSALSAVHQDQRFSHGSQPLPHSVPFRWLVLLMSLGLLLSTLFGIVMAFRLTHRRRWVWTCLILGVALPVLLLYLGGGL